MYLFYPLVAGTGFLSFLVFTTIATSQNTAKFQKVVCVIHDKNLITNHSCNTRPISRQKTIVSVSVAFNRTLDHIMVHAKLYKKFNDFKPFLIDITESACDGLAKKSNAPYIKIFFDLVGPYTNLNHTCPFESRWVSFSNVLLDLTNLRVVMPKGEYRLDIMPSFNRNKLKALTVQVYLEIGEKD